MPRSPQGFGKRAKPIHLSLCMIVKNEAHRLANCLESISDFVDEIIVVDTGSTDNTVKIAQKLGARVQQFKWCDDFAAARNSSLGYARGQWVLVLDADEILVPEVKPVLADLMRRQNCLAINLLRLEVGAKQSPYSLVSRLFRRQQDIYFQGFYHELVDRRIMDICQQEPDWQVVTLDSVAIHHYGYQNHEIALKHKYELAKRLMTKHLAEFPQDSYMYSKLGALYAESGDLEKGLNLLQTGLEIAQRESSDRQTLFELYYHLGIAYSHQSAWVTAQNFYQQALELNVPNKVKLPAYSNLGNLHQSQGDYAAAIAAYTKVIDIDPNFAQGHYNLGIALKASKQLDRAVLAYTQAIAIDPQYAEAYQNLGVVWMHLGQIPAATQAFEQAIHHHEQQQNFASAQALRDGLRDLGLV